MMRAREEEDHHYRENVIFKQGLTEKFQRLKQDLVEYESLATQPLPNQDGAHPADYSGVNKELGQIFAHMALFRAPQEDDASLAEIQRILAAIPQEALLELFEETATSVQKKTAFRILERLFRAKKEGADQGTQTSGGEYESAKQKTVSLELEITRLRAQHQHLQQRLE